jgi:hypothetical protein
MPNVPEDLNLQQRGCDNLKSCLMIHSSTVSYESKYPVWHVKLKHVLRFLSYFIGLMMTQ